MNFKNLLFLLKGGGILKRQEQTVNQAPGILRQLQIYRKGMLGVRPGLPISIEAMEQRAKARLSKEAYDYVAGGAGGESTMRANREALDRWSIVPRMLRPISERTLSVELLGRELPMPVLLAPIGVQGIVHREGEVAAAKAAASLRIPLILSTASSHPLETVAAAMGDVPHWYQLYWPKDQQLAASFIRRAEAAGYSALVVTLDTSLLSWRERDLQNAYLPFLVGDGLANYFSDPVFRSALAQPPEKNPLQAVRHFAKIFSNPSLSWNDLRWLRKHTRLPILLKGILHPDDVRAALKYGIDGIIVSNHGGRQIDGAIGALDALPDCVKAAGKRVPVLFDGGIRRGADVLKAIAVGARAVLLGRPYIWGLAVAGERGVCHVLENLLADFDLTLGLAGFQSVDEISIDCLRRSTQP